MSDKSFFPEITFVESDTETIAESLISGFEKVIGRPLYPADPVRILLQFAAQVLSQERAIINQSAKRNVPRYAKGQYLDSLCELFYGVERLQATSAQCSVEFSLTEPQEAIQIIPRGTRVTMDGSLLFSLEEDLVIPPGETAGVGRVICETPGTVGNGFLPGQIAVCVDVYPYYKTAVNITESAGGSDTESDAELYERMRQSLESCSTAGPAGAYVYHAKSVSNLISDVKAYSPAPGEVDVRVMCDDGKLPEKELLDKVSATLNDYKVRPLTDHVTVRAPSVRQFDIDLTFYLTEGGGMSIAAAEAIVGEAVEDYIGWQVSKMGRDINPSMLIQKVMQTGVKRVEVTSPAFVVLSDIEVAQVGKISITNGGYEYE